MSGLPSDEVAEDYKGSLEDLVTNDRYQISNLTLIARENVEHAEAISRVLQNHINRAPPARKLPALYVLDSIAKNVGTPYTLYFGRNLHQTFMLAYSQVDAAVRRKLEEMLKTWREPVPGSTQLNPVFPLTATQSIVDQLSKFRSATTPANRYPTPTNPPARVMSAQPYRQTPTPPQLAAQYPPGVPSHLRSPQPSAAVPHYQPPYTQPPSMPFGQTPSVSYTQPYQPPPPSQPGAYYQQPQLPVQQQPPPAASATSQYPQHPLPSPVAAVDVTKLHRDIDDLTTDAKIECATHPMDQRAQRQLTSLQTLKEILDSGHASESDLSDIQNTIAQKMSEKNALKPQAVAAAQGTTTPAPAYSYPTIQPPPQAPALPTAPAPVPTLPPFLNSTNLAELLRATVAQQNGVQPNYYSQQSINPSPSVNVPPAPPTATMMTTTTSTMIQQENPILAQLRASGILSATSTPPTGTTTPSNPLSVFAPATYDVSLTSASIKIPRLQLVASFLSRNPNICSTCGRRFSADELGKEKKARHLDWHFKTKARTLDAEKRGQNRSWYVDEREWISSKELEDGGSEENGQNGHIEKKTKKAVFVRAPTDPVLRALPCPIDQEPFKSEWSEEVQDFIWKDTVLVGGKYFHASCYDEVVNARQKEKEKLEGGSTPLGGTLGRITTPDSVLGKRKAEEGVGSGSSSGAKTRVKLET